MDSNLVDNFEDARRRFEAAVSAGFRYSRIRRAFVRVSLDSEEYTIEVCPTSELDEYLREHGLPSGTIVTGPVPDKLLRNLKVPEFILSRSAIYTRRPTKNPG